MSSDLELAKRRLQDKLGANYNIYIQLLGKWFRGFISKEEFDRSAKQLVKQTSILEHNKFWLAFFHHCASSSSDPNYDNSLHQYGEIGLDNHLGCNGSQQHAMINSAGYLSNEIPTNRKIRCLPNKVMTHMKIFVIVWEMGLDSINDQVSMYINLALQHFLKNIITELICSKTAYRLRESRFKYAIGVKPMNPYLGNSLRIYTSNLEYDPYQIESNKMNSSLLDTCVYNDTLFPARLYEAQALYEFACSTTSVSDTMTGGQRKRARLSEITLNDGDHWAAGGESDRKEEDQHQKRVKEVKLDKRAYRTKEQELNGNCNDSDDHDDDHEHLDQSEKTTSREVVPNQRRVTMHHLLTAFSTNKSIIPCRSLYSINLQRIFTKYPS